jgi:hypothetical protein
MREQTGQAIGKIAALAFVPCALALCLLAIYFKPLFNDLHLNALNLARHEQYVFGLGR